MGVAISGGVKLEAIHKKRAARQICRAVLLRDHLQRTFLRFRPTSPRMPEPSSQTVPENGMEAIPVLLFWVKPPTSPVKDRSGGLAHIALPDIIQVNCFLSFEIPVVINSGVDVDV